MTQPYWHSEPAATWQLGADASRLRSAAEAWERLGSALHERADELGAVNEWLRGSEWSGQTRNSFEDLAIGLEVTTGVAGGEGRFFGGQLGELAGLAKLNQAALDSNMTTLISSGYKSHQGQSEVHFSYTEEDAEEFESLIREARRLRAEYVDAAFKLDYAFSHIWGNIASRWQEIAVGSDPFILPDEVDGTSVLIVDGTAIVNTGAGEDQVTVTVDPATGEILVTVNGEVHRFASGTPVIVRAGGGNDVVEVTQGISVDLVLMGSAGDDNIVGGDDDRIIGNRGADRLFGANGAELITGGAGNDYAEGRNGADTLLMGAGSDTGYGGGGEDILSSGDGAGYLEGGDGDDELYAFNQEDLVSGGTGENQLHGRGNSITTQVANPRDLSFIKIEGSPEFVARVQADLHALQAGPFFNDGTGPTEGSPEIIQSLADTKNGNFWLGEHSLTIREAPDATVTATRESDSSVFGNRETIVHYNPVKNIPDAAGGPAGAPVVDLLEVLRDEVEDR